MACNCLLIYPSNLWVFAQLNRYRQVPHMCNILEYTGTSLYLRAYKNRSYRTISRDECQKRPSYVPKMMRQPCRALTLDSIIVTPNIIGFPDDLLTYTDPPAMTLTEELPLHVKPVRSVVVFQNPHLYVDFFLFIFWPTHEGHQGTRLERCAKCGNHNWGLRQVCASVPDLVGASATRPRWA